MLTRLPVAIIVSLSLLYASCSKKSDSMTPVTPPDKDTPVVVVVPPVTYNQKDIASVDNAVKTFMATYHVPGMSVAVTKDEKLVYVKSYGQMDQTDTNRVKNSSLFRIASLSKQFTSVAIMRLIEQQKLSMTNTLFGTGGILGADYPSAPAALNDITIDQLLHHTSGNWPNDGTDPMFQQQSMTAAQLIQWTLANYADKGKRGQYYYSNFGYCLLGRVIEKVSGKAYAQFVNEEVLTPAGITDMLISGNTLADRKPNEVKYYGQGEDPYSMNVARMDSHGGWLATATDLLRFMVRVDGFTNKADILQPATETLMTTGSAGNANYACGWAVNSGNNWWHNGSLPGTITEHVRSAKGFNWSMLCNTRDPASYQMDTDLDNLLWPVINDSSTPWEDVDQF